MTDAGFRYRLGIMELASLLKTHRDEIIKEWMAKIPTLSERYSRLPTEEIRRTVTLATDANFAFLIENDRSKMDDT